MQINQFNFGVIRRKPTNTLGVDDMFYFGTVDGVEIGSQCNSKRESLDDCINILHRDKPYKLELLLLEEVVWISELINTGKRPELEIYLKAERDTKIRLINIIKLFKSI